MYYVPIFRGMVLFLTKKYVCIYSVSTVNFKGDVLIEERKKGTKSLFSLVSTWLQ